MVFYNHDNSSLSTNISRFSSLIYAFRFVMCTKVQLTFGTQRGIGLVVHVNTLFYLPIPFAKNKKLIYILNYTKYLQICYFLLG